MKKTKEAPAMEETRNCYLCTVLTATTIIAMIYIGGVSSFSILYKELLDFYHTRSGDTAIIQSLCQFLNFGIGPFANYLSEIYSFRSVMIAGGFLGFLGLFLSAFVPRMEFWILTYGALTGVGFGLVYSPCFTVVNFYFKRRRALAIGIVLFGTGVGSVLFPFLYKMLLDLYGLQGAVIVISALSLNICVCAALIRQPKQLKKNVLLNLHLRENCEMGSSEEHAKSTFSPCNCTVCHSKRPIFCFSLFRQSSFLIYALAFMCSIFAYLSNFVMIPGHARVQGMTSAEVAEFLSVAGGVMILARPTVGWLADSNFIEKRNIIGTCVILGGIFSIVLPWILGETPAGPRTPVPLPFTFCWPFTTRSSYCHETTIRSTPYPVLRMRPLKLSVTAGVAR
ncbi:monocarboxylate transporter 12-like isoform X4 [Ostrea edulis]|uniref:monocarboxylate transporter 12-like isoform X4 n=1 Tax=Ostrea edulis TaxID=37623 RepID=UPI0024AFF725|nr:monocarboxylate transporter 12-like isoform X4 [Ostrea edulis]